MEDVRQSDLELLYAMVLGQLSDGPMANLIKCHRLLTVVEPVNELYLFAFQRLVDAGIITESVSDTTDDMLKIKRYWVRKDICEMIVALDEL